MTEGGRKGPITRLCIAIDMITTVNGTATTPLMTADQNSAFIGLTWIKSIPTPMKVETAMTP